RFGTDGAAVGVTQVGLQEATTTVTNLGAVATPIDFTAQPTSFQISLAGSSPASGNGTVSINLNTPVANSVQDVVNLINSAIFSAATPITVQAVANGGNIEFRDLTEGASSTITLSGVTGGNALSTALNNAGPSVAGVPAAT